MIGKDFYEGLSDEELLDVIRKKGEELGYSPGQKEIFWVWRFYIKQRFKKWPYALLAAGMSKSAGKGGKPLSKIREETEEYQALLNCVRQKAQELCRIPHPQELPEVIEKLKQHSDRWNDVLKDAGISREFFYENVVYKISDLEEQYCNDLKKIKKLAEDLHRPPFKSELPVNVKERLIKRCGSYRNVLFQIDMEPIQKKKPFFYTETKESKNLKRKEHHENLKECCYEIINPDDQTKSDLMILYKLWKREGENLDKKKIEPQLRKRLQISCGTWSNALYQLSFIEKNKK